MVRKIIDAIGIIILVLLVLMVARCALADTVVTVTVTQSQSSSGGSVSRPVCDWTYPSSCYAPRTVIVQRPYRKRK